MKFVNLTPHALNVLSTTTCGCGTADFQAEGVWVCGPCGAMGGVEDASIAIDASGEVARVATEITPGHPGLAVLAGFSRPLQDEGGGGGITIVALRRRVLGDVTGLPAPAAGVVFIVAGMVAAHPSVAGRADVVSPGPLVRDESGRPIGCRGLFAS